MVDVATQVVAGLNYRLVLDVSGGDQSTVEAVVYGMPDPQWTWIGPGQPRVQLKSMCWEMLVLF